MVATDIYGAYEYACDLAPQFVDLGYDLFLGRGIEYQDHLRV